MRKIILYTLVISQLLVIFLLILRLTNKNTKTTEIFVDKMSKQSFVFFPSRNLQYFYEPKTNALEPDYDPTYKIFYHLNSDTLHEFKNYSLIKPYKIYRIIALGDSWTYGIHVETQGNWTEKLEKKLNDNLQCKNIRNFEVLNLGVPGYDTQYALERFKKRGIKYDTDMVLWLITDVERINEKILPSMDAYIKALKEDYKLNGAISNKEKEDLDYYKMAWIMVKTQLEKDIGRNNIINFQQKYLGELYKNYQGNIVFMTAPTILDKDSKQLLSPFTSKSKTFVHKTTDILSIQDATLKDDGHPSEKGHELVAQNLFNYLTKNKIFPCN